ncbi:MAG: acetylxylan esterase [Solirubrobacteraceae bacterium]
MLTEGHSKSPCLRTAGMLVAAALALATPAAADAAIGSVFTTSNSPVTCTVQVGANAGQRFCSGSPSRVPSWDGTPTDVSVTLPPVPSSGPDGPFPLVAVFHGYGGSKITPASSTTQRWIARGYAVFSKSDRGFGQSCGGPSGSRPTGCATGYVRLMHNAYEIRDAQYLMSLLADEGVIDGQRIGATGGSYGGGQSYALGALRDRTQLPDGTLVPWTSPGGKPMSIAATAPEYGWTNLAYALVPNGSTLDYVANAPYRGPLGDRRFGIQKSNWSSSLYTGGLVAGGFYAPEGSDSTADLTGWQNAAATGGPYDSNATAQQMIDELSANHSAYSIDDSRPPAPALLSNGWNDDLFPVDEAVRYYNKVRTRWPDNPITMFHLDFGHSPRAAAFGADTAQLATAENAWFDYYVKNVGTAPVDAVGGVDVLTSNCATTTTTTRAAGALFHAATWAALAPGEVRLSGGAAQTITAPGTAPSNTFTTGSICTTTSSADNASAATYKLDPAPVGGFTLAGSPTVIADMDVLGANDGVRARLYDVDVTSSTERLIGRQLLRPVGVGTGPARQVFQLHPQAWRVAAGHVVKLELLAQDSSYARGESSAAPQQSVVVTNLELRLPTIDQPGTGGIVHMPSPKALPDGYVLARDLDTAPAITTSTSALAATGGAAATPIDGALTIADADSVSLTGATAQITSGYRADEDVLGYVAANGISATVSGDTVTLSGSATVADYQAALRSITYRNASTAASGSRTVSFGVTDSSRISSAVSTRDISVTPAPPSTAQQPAPTPTAPESARPVDSASGPAPATPAAVPTALRILHPSVRLVGRSIALRLVCSGPAGSRCTGRVLIDPLSRKRGTGGRYGRVTFDLAAGEARSARLVISRGLLRRVRARHLMHVRATAVYTGNAAARLKISRSLAVAMPRLADRRF